MNTFITRIIACILGWTTVFAGCGRATEQPPLPPTELQTLVGDSPADSIGPKIQAQGMTVWLDPVAHPEWQKRGLRWKVEGRASKNIGKIYSFVGGRHYTDSTMTSARKFTVLLTREELGRVIEGDYLYLELEPSVGSTELYSAAIAFKPKFHTITGSDRLNLLPWVDPILTPDGVKMRAQATTEPGFEIETVYTDDDFNPELSFWPGWDWDMDWHPEELLLASDILDDPVFFILYDGHDNRYRATANIEIRATKAGLAVGHPETAFPAPPCLPEVERCLNALPAAARDTEECGFAPDVRACFNPQATW